MMPLQTTSKRFCFTAPWGVVVCAPLAARRDGETEAQWISRCHADTIRIWIRDGRLPAGDYPMTVLDQTDIPTDRSYRNAWTLDGKAFGHDMKKARDLHRDKIREARKPLLEAQDVQLMRAIETGGDTKPIADEKKRLRDAPADPRIDAAKTIEDLKAVTL